MARQCIGLAVLIVTSSVQAQNIIRGEYFIDQDLGWGANTLFELDADNDTVGVQVTVDLDGYAPGIHTVGIRTLDGGARWSLTNFSAAVVIAPPIPVEELVEVEYFLNQDPGFGNASTGWSGSSTELLTEQFEADLSEAVVGMNTLFIRSRTPDGLWSLTNHTPIVLIDPGTTTGLIDRMETFTLPGTDPGFGQAEGHVVVGAAEDLASYVLTAPIPIDFFVEDTLMIRAHDSRGYWSFTNHVIVEGNTDVDELASRTGISVFPNPFTDAFTVQPGDAQPLRAILYDPQGKLVHDEVLNASKRIDLSGLSSGAYTALFWKGLDESIG